MVYITTYPPKESSREKESVLGKGLLEFALKKEYGAELKNLHLDRGDKGKPFLRERPWIHFNVSHTRGIVVLALSDLPVGIDVEEIRPYTQAVARRILTPSERDQVSWWTRTGRFQGEKNFFRYWTLKESYVKATGQGLSFPFGNLEFGLDEKGQIESNCKGYEFYQSCLWNQYMLSVCVKKRGEEDMTYETLFEEIKTMFAKADVSGIRDHLAYQFNITGEGEGTFYAEVSDGILTVEPYDYKDRDALFTCSADTLLNIVKGKTDPIAAFTLGKLKVDGSIEKALMIQQFMKK